MRRICPSIWLAFRWVAILPYELRGNVLKARSSNLAHVVSISPVLDPEKSTYAIDDVPLLRRYFRKKWLRSLQKKQAYFPDLYDFSDVLTLDSITEMTDLMIERYSDYETASDYFSHYALLKDALVTLLFLPRSSPRKMTRSSRWMIFII